MKKIKVGTVFYCLLPADNDKPEWNEYHVRTIRGGKIYAIWKLPRITWGKQSTKHFDYGWLDPLPAWTRISWPAGEMPPEWRGLFTTKKAVKDHEIKGHNPDDYETPEEAEAWLAAVKRLRVE